MIKEYYLFKNKEEITRDKIKSGKIKPYKGHFIEIKRRRNTFTTKMPYYYYLIYDKNLNIILDSNYVLKGVSYYKDSCLLSALVYVKNNLLGHETRVSEEDPYGEELWDDENSIQKEPYTTIDILKDFRRRKNSINSK